MRSLRSVLPSMRHSLIRTPLDGWPLLLSCPCWLAASPAIRAALVLPHYYWHDCLHPYYQVCVWRLITALPAHAQHC